MDETKQNQSAYAREHTKLATLEGSPVPHEDLSSLHPDEAAAAAEESQAEAKEIAQSLAGKVPAQPRKESRYSPVTVPGSARVDSTPVTEFLDFLKQTKRVWLMAVAAIVGLILVVTLAQRGFGWLSEKRERRHEQAVASTTPEHLLARCGQPAEDTTKNMYPILMRTMTYQVSRSETYTFDFSRTAEEKSDWVFLSMKDATGKTYDTPEEKVAAMSCLDSRR